MVLSTPCHPLPPSRWRGTERPRSQRVEHPPALCPALRQTTVLQAPRARKSSTARGRDLRSTPTPALPQLPTGARSPAGPGRPRDRNSATAGSTPKTYVRRACCFIIVRKQRSSVLAAGRLLPLLTGLRDTLGIRAVHYLGAARLLAVAVAGWSGLLALSAPGGSWEPKLPDPRRVRTCAWSCASPSSPSCS